MSSASTLLDALWAEPCAVAWERPAPDDGEVNAAVAGGVSIRDARLVPLAFGIDRNIPPDNAPNVSRTWFSKSAGLLSAMVFSWIT